MMKKILLYALSIVLFAVPAYAGKINDRTSATTPLDGTETVGIIQGGADRKTTVTNLTKGASGSVYYAEANGIACDGVTNDTSAIIALGTTAQTQALASGKNTKVVFKAGSTCKVTNVTWPSRVSLDMNGAVFAAINGTDHTQPVLKIDAFGNTSNGLTYTDLSVIGLSSGTGSHAWDPTYAETSICIQFNGAFGARATFGTVQGCFIGVQALADTQNIAYSEFRGGYYATNKISVDIRTGNGGGFANENRFVDLNIAPSSSMNNFGQLVGVRASSTDSGQHSQNNNRFHDISFQMSNHVLDWSSGGTKTQFRRYANITGVSPKYWIFMSATATGGTDEPPVTDTVTFSSSSGLLGTFANYLPVNGTQIYLTNSGGSLPTGTSLGTWYWVGAVSGKTFKLATSFANYQSNTFIAFTDAGSGTHSAEAQKGWQYVDNNSKTWQVESVKMRVPFYIEDTGFATSKVTGARWETGFGPPVLYRMGARFSVSLTNQDNDFEFYTLPTTSANGTSQPYALGDLEASTAIHPTSYNIQSRIHGYGQLSAPPVETVLIDNLSRRVVMSAQSGSSWAGTISIAGMAFATRNAWGTQQPYATNAASGNTSILCKDSVAFQFNANQWTPMVFIDALNYKKFKIQPDLVSSIAWLDVKGFDSNFQPLTLDLQNHTVAGSQFSFTSATGGLLGLPAPNNQPMFVGVPNTTAGATTRYVMAGLRVGTSTKIRGLTISTTPTYGFTGGALRVVTPWGNASDLRRSSLGTPTGGWFMRTGEIITNLDTSAGQPLYWTVKTPGAMAPTYADATGIIADELRSDGTNIKSATAACTTNGANMAADAGCTWTTQAVIAVLTASTQVY